MSSYEEEHNIPRYSLSKKPGENETNIREHERPWRPDLSTFYANIRQLDVSGLHERHDNPHAVPLPQDIEALYRLLADALIAVATRTHHPERAGLMSVATGMGMGTGTGTGDWNWRTALTEEGVASRVQVNMVNELLSIAEAPPRVISGVPETYFDELERVDKRDLKSSMQCPICANAFLDDEYPLVVRLPCHKDHVFDLECIRPWLILNPTCPLDRVNLLKPLPPRIQLRELNIDQETEEDYDDYFA